MVCTFSPKAFLFVSVCTARGVREAAPYDVN